MTRPTPETPTLDEAAVSEIEALSPFTYSNGTQGVVLTLDQRDALCATVKHLRERVQLLDSRWCECGHTKDKHGFFSDHDECYECDQASPDLCCEWRPVARPETITDFRTHAIQLCKDKAAEHLRIADVRTKNQNDAGAMLALARADAISHVREELEKL